MNGLPQQGLTVRWPASGRSQRALARRAVIIAAYVALFWIALPWLLFRLGARFDALLALPAPGLYARLAGAAVLAVGALALARAMLGLVREGRGLPISHLPPSHLVTGGAYGRARHPIYVAFTAAFAGLALAAGSFGAAFGAGAVLTVFPT